MNQLEKFNYHLTVFLAYNQRLVKRDWKNEVEEEIVRSTEYFHCQRAAMLMPPEMFSQLLTPNNNK
ncbi:hypothetical protein [Limnovirga soli]|uniref:Uncharacterized protein n=1 Tax=Limnovirga soli TaxID=2656915 RepID=A0A8J8FDV6_9BACT|nr:hypothetical protein [Limnovirga soli]NNV55885.1 hypothetical protein [Limnovirga soli]